MKESSNNQVGASFVISMIEKFDFTKASIKQFQTKQLDKIHTKFAHNLKISLSKSLKVLIDVSIISTESITFDSFLHSCSQEDLIVITNSITLGGQILFILERKLNYQLIEYLMGGKKYSTNKNPNEGKEYSKIELSVLERIIKTIINEYSNAWLKIFPIHLKKNRIETNPNFVSNLMTSSGILNVILHIDSDNIEGTFKVVIPQNILMPIKKKLSSIHDY